MSAELPQIDPKTFKITDLKSVWDLTSSQKWLVDNLIPENGLIMITGESGHGKSTITLLLADAISKGEPFLGLQTQQREVLIVDKENGVQIYHERFARFNLPKNENMRVWGNFSGIDLPRFVNDKVFKDYATEVHPLIIFDSFVAFHPGDEQDATITRTYMNQYRELVGAGATVLLIHHTGKGENTKEYRGSSDIKASLDVGYKLSMKKAELKMLQLRPFKVREGLIRPLTLSVEEDKLVLLDGEFIPETDKDWKPVLEFICNHPGVNQTQIIQGIPELSNPRIRKILIAAEMKGSLRIEKTGLKNASSYFPSAHGNAR